MSKSALGGLAALIALVAAALVTSPSASAQVPGLLTVTEGDVVLGQPFSLLADGCPGPGPVGADYSVEFRIDYQPPPDASGSYNVTLDAAPLGAERFSATWALPSDAPTTGGFYRVSADCIGNELGDTFVWFSYPPVNMTVTDEGEPIVTATPRSLIVGQSFEVTANGCPGPNPVGADYSVRYTVSFLPPPQLPGAPDPGSYSETTVVPGAYGLHRATLTIPADAPTLGGAYRVTAECWGNELGDDFLWHADYAPVDLTVGAGDTPACWGRAITVFLANGDEPTDDDDVILGTPGDDTIDAGAGNDIVCGEAGDDIINGGDGDDLVYGGSGRDALHGMDGDDTLHGQTGGDVLFGGAGDDTLRGGWGNDTLHGHLGDDDLNGNGGNDRVYGYDGNDRVAGDGGNDVLIGNDGDDHLSGWGGDDRVHGSSGQDTLAGGTGNDRLAGGDGDDTLTGGEGDDTLHGQLGNDRLFGDQGNDRIFGYGGDDRLDGGAHTDTCHGNEGTDDAFNCERSTGTA